MTAKRKFAARLAFPLLGLLVAGCPEHYMAAGGMMATAHFVRPDAYIEGTHQPVAIYVTPDSAVCDVTRGKAYLGTVRNGYGKLYVAKGKERISVNCEAIGYESQGTTIESSLPFHAVPHCAFDALCEPAVRSGELNQYPGKVTLILSRLQPPAAQEMAAAKERQAAALAAPVPAETPADTAASSVGLTPLPPAVQALRDGAPGEKAPMAEAATLEAPLGTWRTTSGGTKGWWGRDVPRSILLPPTALLALQRTDGDWGLFDYRGKDGTRGRVWIALTDVRLAN